MDEQLDNGNPELVCGKIMPCGPSRKGWQDSIPRNGEYSYLDDAPMPNLAAVRKREENETYPSLNEVLTEKYEQDTYKITTLGSKVLNQEIHKLNALAGIAKQNIATPFSIMEQQLRGMKKNLREMENAVDIFEEHLKTLKTLAVIE